MATEPASILALAERLLASEVNECGARSAISRAYYAVLHMANEALPREFSLTAKVRRGVNSHKAVIDAMDHWGSSLSRGRIDAQKAARLLAKLKRARIKADYYLQNEEVARKASLFLILAKQIAAYMEPYRQQQVNLRRQKNREVQDTLDE